MLSLLRSITVTGFLFSLLLMIDAVFPKAITTQSISKVQRGIEHSKNNKVLTHFRVLLADGSYFPIFRDDYSYFREPGQVEVSTSRLLGQPTHIRHVINGRSTIPALGLYSYFFAVPCLLLISCLFGFMYWNDPQAHVNATVFIIFLMCVSLYLID